MHKGSSSVRSYFTDCSVTMTNSDISSTNASGANVGSFVGDASKATVINGKLTMKNSTIFSEATKGGLVGGGYNSTSVGGVYGYSGAGSSNSPTGWGHVGCTIEGFEMKVVNDSFMNVIYAKETTGEGINAGGLIGLSFNNCDVKDATVTIKNGRIVAERTTENASNAGYGVHAGGIAGRLEHTSSLTNCIVNGDNLTIEGIGNESMNYVGGLSGDMFNTFHRDIVPVKNCKVLGKNGTKIGLTLNKTNNSHYENYVGGLNGRVHYKVDGATVDGVEVFVKGIQATGTSYVSKSIGFFKSQGLTSNPEGPQFATLSGPSTVSGLKVNNVTLTITDCTGVTEQE